MSALSYSARSYFAHTLAQTHTLKAIYLCMYAAVPTESNWKIEQQLDSYEQGIFGM